MVLGDIVGGHRLYLAAKPSNVRVDVDGLSYPRPPTVLLPGGVRLECEALGSMLFFFTLSPRFSCRSHCPRGPTCYDHQAKAQSPWTGAALSNHLAWDGA
jgi:hypothetical protein